MTQTRNSSLPGEAAASLVEKILRRLRSAALQAAFRAKAAPSSCGNRLGIRLEVSRGNRLPRYP